MPSFVWAKMWIDTLDDYKLGLLSDHLWRRFFEFVLLAKEIDTGGYLPAIPAIAWRLRTAPHEIESDLQSLAIDDLQLLTRDDTGWYVTNFVKRQETAMDSAERMRRLRERERRAAYNDDGDDLDDTARNAESDDTRDAGVTNRHIEERRGDKERGEESDLISPVAPLSLGDPSPPLERHTLLPDEIPKRDPAFVDAWNARILPMLDRSLDASNFQNYAQTIQPIALRDGCVFLGVSTVYNVARARQVYGGNPNNKLLFALRSALDNVDSYQFVSLQPGGT